MAITETSDEPVRWADRSARLRLRVDGPDRLRFLQNLTTNDLARLQPGQGAETFVTSPQGKTLGFLTAHVSDDHVLLRSDGGAFEFLKPHFEKYGLFDDVSWSDQTATCHEAHVFGAGLGPVLDVLGLGELRDADLAHRLIRVDRHACLAIAEAPTGRPGLTLIGPTESLDEVRQVLERSDPGFRLREVDALTFDVLRIEAGTPVYGKEVTPASLPQELDRDARAISFRKGCYLGQETVARIDALGHVNKLLRGLRFGPGPVPTPGAELHADGKAVGQVTSAGFSGRFGCPVALGIVRRTHATIGRVLDVPEIGAGTIVPLPMRSDS